MELPIIREANRCLTCKKPIRFTFRANDQTGFFQFADDYAGRTGLYPN